MSALDYIVEPEVESPDDDVNDAVFIWATATIGGCDVVEEFLACKMYPLASSFSFRGMAIILTLVSKVRTPLPLFPVEDVSVENVGRVLAEIEMEAKRLLGSFGPKEHYALNTVKIPNDGHVNRVFEQMGVPYA
jgi:hypothetical protein